jgi:hypothetical protein
MHFSDTAELHAMAARNHTEWAQRAKTTMGKGEEGGRIGWYVQAMGFRKMAVECEGRAKSAEERGDGETAWKEGEQSRVWGYKAGKAEDERH